ncbi:hypothetical protein EDB85DRAFT_2222046 [Lactarius pseudohatsudake]|nr:hypothetical protein EDB85DRAFT_2222046 [Lactarius pseudohatsudake]
MLRAWLPFSPLSNPSRNPLCLRTHTELAPYNTQGQHGRQFPGSPTCPRTFLFSPSRYSAILNIHDAPLAQPPALPVTRRRHRQTLTLRGHTEHLKQKLAQCGAILKHRIPGFELENLEEIFVDEGVEVEANVPPISASSPGSSFLPKGYPYIPLGPHMIPGYPPMPPYYPSSKWSALPASSTYATSPGLQSSLTPKVPAPSTAYSAPMSSSRSLCPVLCLLTDPYRTSREETLVSMTCRTPRCRPRSQAWTPASRQGDSIAAESAFPHDANKWVLVPMRCDSVTSSPSTPGPTHTFLAFLPKDRDMVQHIASQQHDPGFLCSVYLIFTLSTLSELNHCAYGLDREAKNKATAGGTPSPRPSCHLTGTITRTSSSVPSPSSVLRVTICSLQAFILLHWYLYTEHQGRTLWCLVGSTVCLGIELGLNHDLTTQTIFDGSECQLRIHLWGIVFVHDRGTSLLLGCPLAIAPNDTNTPHPPTVPPIPHFFHSGSLRRTSARFGFALALITTALMALLLNVSPIFPTHLRKFWSKYEDFGNNQISTLNTSSRDVFAQQFWLGQPTPHGTHFVFNSGGQPSSSSFKLPAARGPASSSRLLSAHEDVRKPNDSTVFDPGGQSSSFKLLSAHEDARKHNPKTRSGFTIVDTSLPIPVPVDNPIIFDPGGVGFVLELTLQRLRARAPVIW